MEYSDYSYSAATQAAFFKAEAKLLSFDGRLSRSSYARYVRETLMSIDAVFAIRMAHDIALPVAPLINAYGLAGRKHCDEAVWDACGRAPCFRFSEEEREAALQALHYMQALDWISSYVSPGTVVTIDTVLRIHEMLLNGDAGDNRYHGFRRTFLPHKKGFDPVDIPSAVNDLCRFINIDLFSPLGQASVVHHAFERIVPFDSMIDRTGLVLAFSAMRRRGLFSNGYMVPICWGASINRGRRKKIKDLSRGDAFSEAYKSYREYWAVHNARNTYYSVVIADSFLDAVEGLRLKWSSSLSQIPANSALDRLLDLFLAVPCVSVGRAAKVIEKSYGATNEAMRQLAQLGIIEEVAIDGRERIFMCGQSGMMITRFVDRLIEISCDSKLSGGKEDLSWTPEREGFDFRACS